MLATTGRGRTQKGDLETDGWLHMLGTVSGTIGGVSMVEWMCHCRGGLVDPPASCLEASLLFAFGT